MSNGSLLMIGEYLASNDELKYIDLEGNDLYDHNKPELSGVRKLAEGI